MERSEGRSTGGTGRTVWVLCMMLCAGGGCVRPDTTSRAQVAKFIDVLRRAGDGRPVADCEGVSAGPVLGIDEGDLQQLLSAQPAVQSARWTPPSPHGCAGLDVVRAAVNARRFVDGTRANAAVEQFVTCMRQVRSLAVFVPGTSQLPNRDTPASHDDGTTYTQGFLEIQALMFDLKTETRCAIPLKLSMLGREIVGTPEEDLERERRKLLGAFLSEVAR